MGICRVVAFAAAFAVVVLAESSEEGMACEALFNDTLNDCCDSKFLFDDSSESTKCKNSKDEEELSCDDYKCLLEEDDLLVGEKISEGNVNKMLDKWENEYPKEKPMIDRARSECLGGKYLEYINEENCVPLKFYTCLYINSIIWYGYESVCCANLEVRLGKYQDIIKIGEVEALYCCVSFGEVTGADFIKSWERICKCPWLAECQTWKTDVQCRKMKEYALMCKTLQDSK